jgi:hypothetical protein
LRSDVPTRARGEWLIAIVVMSVVVAVGCGRSESPSSRGLTVEGDSELILFAPYRVPNEFESLGVPKELASVLADRSGDQEVWHVAVVRKDRLIGLMTSSAPRGANKVPGAMVVGAVGAVEQRDAAEGRQR